MTFALVSVFVLYGLLVLFLYIGWERAIGTKTQNTKDSYSFISVLIPVRNESYNINFLLDDLASQSYPADCFEIVIIDDHSEDDTLTIVNEKAKSFSNCRVIQSNGQGKKSALTEGINQVKGEIILTTDADCRAGVHWLSSVNAAFESDSIKMVFGPVKIESSNSLFSKMQALEFSSLIGSGAATMAFGIPTMCNGANLSFRKVTFNEVSGYEGNEHVASGDDEFLMRKISAKYPTGIRFNNFEDGVVITQPQQNLNEFTLQRLRWAGKWKYHYDVGSKLLALYIFIFHGSVLMIPALFVIGEASGDMLLSLFLAKATLEYVFLSAVTTRLKIQWNWPAFIMLQLLYSFYAVGIGLASLFVAPSWKGRK